MGIALAALIGLACYLVTAPRRRNLQHRLHRITSPENQQELSGLDFSSRRFQYLVCALGAFAIWFLLSGIFGAIAAIAVMVVGPRLLARLEGSGTRKRRYELASAAPLIADMFTACLSSGASISAAADAAGNAIGGASADLLAECLAQFRLGADSEKVWAPLLAEPATAPIARAVLRSTYSGAPLTDVLLRVADDLRAHHRAELEQAAKAVGVKAVAPLGLCFLPAFMLLGVIPLIGSLVMKGLS